MVLEIRFFHLINIYAMISVCASPSNLFIDTQVISLEHLQCIKNKVDKQHKLINIAKLKKKNSQFHTKRLASFYPKNLPKVFNFLQLSTISAALCQSIEISQSTLHRGVLLTILVINLIKTQRVLAIIGENLTYLGLEF